MVLSLLLIAAAALVCVFLVMGWGALLRRALGVPVATPVARLGDFWLGLGLTIAFLQFWHFFRPIDDLCLTLVALVGAAGFVPRQLPQDPIAALRAAFPRALWSGGLAAALALLVAYRSLGFLSHYDTQLYHYPALQWASAYPIVPGLANLHGRFGFNSAYTLFAALLDRGPFEARSYHLVNGVLLLAALLQSAWALVRLWISRRPATAAELFTALMLAPLTTQLPGLVGLSNDVPIFVLGFALVRLLLVLLAAAEDSRQTSFAWFSLAVVAGTGIAIKASFALLALPVALSAFFAFVLANKAADLQGLVRWAGIGGLGAALLLLPWIARSYVLSGYPFYPSTYGALDLPWRVPRSLVLSEALSIRAHAREPGVFWTQALADWSWLGPWWTRAARVLLRPGQIAAVALPALLVRCAARRDGTRFRLALQVIVPALAALVAWFLLAPAPRFAGVLPWVVPVAAAALLLYPRAATASRVGPWLVRATVVAFLLVAVSPDDVTGRPDITGYEPFEPMRAAATQPHTTDSGDQVNVPESGFFCTQAPLPCTPYLRRNLRYVTPGDPAGGFVLDRSWTYADMRQRSALPDGLVTSPELGVCVVSTNACGDRLSPLVAPLQLLVYSERATLAELTVRVRHDEPGTDGNTRSRAAALRVSAQGRALMTLPLSQSETLTTALPLQRDFTLLSITVDDAGAPHGASPSLPLAAVSLRTTSASQ